MPLRNVQCGLEGCEGRHYSAGLCQLHYKRKQLYGTTDLPPTVLVDKFWQSVQKNQQGSCWIWTGYKIGGYGYLRHGRGSRFRTGAHRFSYELHVGPIPEDLAIDHICRVTLCVNPTHLRPMTIGENVLVGVSPSAIAKRRTACAQGHEYTDENTRRNKQGHRRCRECERCKARQAYYRKKARQIREDAA